MSHVSPLSVRITASHFSEEPGRKPYVLYTIRVDRQQEEESWTVDRRYRDFVALRKAVLSCFSGSLRIPLPPKKILGNLDVMFVAQRLNGLQAFLDALQQYSAVMQLPPVLAFFNAKEKCSSFVADVTLPILTFVRDQPDYELSAALPRIGGRPNKCFARLLNVRDRSLAMLSIVQVQVTSPMTEEKARTVLHWLTNHGIEHPLIVTPLRAVLSGDQLFVLEPYFPMGSVKDAIYKVKPDRAYVDKYALSSPGRALPDTSIRRYGRHILQALALLHSRGLVHGHVHTGNMFLSEHTQPTKHTRCSLTSPAALAAAIPPNRLYVARKFQLSATWMIDIVMFGLALAEMAAGREVTQAPTDGGSEELRAVLLRVLDKSREPPTAAELIADAYFAQVDVAHIDGIEGSVAQGKGRDTAALAIVAFQKMIS